MGPITVGMDLAGTLGAVRGRGVVARELNLVVVGVNQSVVAATGHRSFALRDEQTALGRVVVVDALVGALPVVDVVHHVGHADGQSSPVVLRI